MLKYGQFSKERRRAGRIHKTGENKEKGEMQE
jgi:hypothetical protein